MIQGLYSLHFCHHFEQTCSFDRLATYITFHVHPFFITKSATFSSHLLRLALYFNALLMTWVKKPVQNLVYTLAWICLKLKVVTCSQEQKIITTEHTLHTPLKVLVFISSIYHCILGCIWLFALPRCANKNICQIVALLPNTILDNISQVRTTLCFHLLI